MEKKKKEWKVGDFLQDECVACGAPEVWKVESITKEKYSDGVFRTFNISSISNCFGNMETRRSVKDVEEVTREFGLHITKEVSLSQ